MRKGVNALERAIEESAKGGGGYSGRLGFFNLSAGESIVVRFLTDIDDVITCDFYEFINDNKGVGQNFTVMTDFYDDPNATDWVLQLGGRQKVYNSSELTDPSPKTRSVGIAVVLKEEGYTDEKGRTKTRYVDDWSEVETKDGTKHEARKFLVVKQAHKNFWTPLLTMYNEYGETICDRPYKIVRNGGDKDTSYSFIAKEEDPDWTDKATSYPSLHALYGYGTGKTADGVELTAEHPDRFAYCPQTVEEWAEYTGSEDRVKFFLGPLSDREAKESSNKDKAATNSSTSAAAAAAVKPGSLVSSDDEAQAAPPPPAASGGSLAERLARHK
jgi:hypothetical protein